MAHSLRVRLLAWVMLPLAGAVAVDGWISHRNASQTALVVQERLLLGSARIIAEQLRFEDGALQEHIPPAALELFDAGDTDRVFYRVTTASGQIVAGYDELTLPSASATLEPETAYFFDTSVRGLPVHAAALLQPVPTENGISPVLVEIAQTLASHEQLTHSLWIHAMSQQFIILALAGVLILFGLRHGLRPLLLLRDAILAREPGSPQPLNLQMVPSELAPLVVAINESSRRLGQHTRAQGVFIQNAAHQLRTPLTLLNTQVSYAVRAVDDGVRSESLAAIRQTVQQSVRLVNQLLMLSAAEAQDLQEKHESLVRLDGVVRQVLEDLSGQAQAKEIDLGFEMAEPDVPAVIGHAFGLREIAMNLIDNAIRYTQRGGIVTSRIVDRGDSVVLVVEDNGPGIAPDQRTKVLQRFYRIDDRDSCGCGLGLPIAVEFATRMRAQLRLCSPANGRGLAVEVRFTTAVRAMSSTHCEPVRTPCALNTGVERA